LNINTLCIPVGKSGKNKKNKKTEKKWNRVLKFDRLHIIFMSSSAPLLILRTF
jgi:hypothetical protein